MFLLTVQSFSIFGCKEYNQSRFGVDHLVMFMCRVFFRVVGRGCLLWPVHSLDRTLLAFALLDSYSKAKFACYSRCFLTSYFCIPVPYNEKLVLIYYNTWWPRASKGIEPVWTLSLQPWAPPVVSQSSCIVIIPIFPILCSDREICPCGCSLFDSSQPHRLQPTRLLCPWDFPGKSTGVGCHCLVKAYLF